LSLPDRRAARTTVGTPDFGGSCALTFFEPHRGEDPVGRQLRS